MITLDPADAAEQPVLENLFQLYAYDWSELGWLDVGRDGRFADPLLAEYWQDDDRHPFLIRVDGRLAGFALVAARSRLTGFGQEQDQRYSLVKLWTGPPVSRTRKTISSPSRTPVTSIRPSGSV